jgi:hypothetical protein
VTCLSILLPIASYLYSVGKYLGEKIGKVLPPNEDEEIRKWKEEEERKRKRDKEGCGIYKSCEPEPVITPPNFCPIPGSA